MYLYVGSITWYCPRWMLIDERILVHLLDMKDMFLSPEQRESSSHSAPHSCLSTTPGEEVLHICTKLTTDMIAALGEATATPFFINKLRDTMLSDATGRRILRDKPRITSTTLDIEKLKLLPDNTIGREYVRWLEIEGVSPDTRAAVPPHPPVSVSRHAVLTFVTGAVHRRPGIGVRDATIPRMPRLLP